MSTLLALSDVVIYRALERAFSRGVSGYARATASEEGIARHEAYRRFPIVGARQGRALEGSWEVLEQLRWRWQLPIPAPEWATVLDHHTRALLTTGAEHNLDDLAEALTALGAGHAV